MHSGHVVKSVPRGTEKVVVSPSSAMDGLCDLGWVTWPC